MHLGLACVVITWLASMALVLRKGSQYMGVSLANRSRGTSGTCRHGGKGRPAFQEYFAHNEDWEGLGVGGIHGHAGGIHIPDSFPQHTLGNSLLGKSEALRTLFWGTD